MGPVVLDTHILLWYLFDPKRLSSTALNAIRQSLAEGHLRNVGDAVNKFAKEAGRGDLNYAVFQLK